MDIKRKMEELFNEWNGPSETFRVVACYVCRSDSQLRLVNNSAYGCSADWLQTIVNNTMQDPSPENMFSITQLSRELNKRNDSEETWKHDDQLRLLNCFPGLHFESAYTKIQKSSDFYLHRRVSDAPRCCLFHRKADIVSILGPVIRAICAVDYNIEQARNEVHSRKRRRLSLNLRGVRPYKLTNIAHEDDYIPFASVNENDRGRVSFSQRVPQSTKDIMRNELLRYGKVRILNNTNNQFKVTWNSFDSETGL